MWSPNRSRRRLEQQQIQHDQRQRQHRVQRASERLERNCREEGEGFANRVWGEPGHETSRNLEERWVQDQRGRRRDAYIPPRTPRLDAQRPEWEYVGGYEGENVSEGEREHSPPPYQSRETLPPPPYSRHGALGDASYSSRHGAVNERLAWEGHARDRNGVSWFDNEALAGLPPELRERRRHRFSFGRSSIRETEERMRGRRTWEGGYGGGYQM